MLIRIRYEEILRVEHPLQILSIGSLAKVRVEVSVLCGHTNILVDEAAIEADAREVLGCGVLGLACAQGRLVAAASGKPRLPLLSLGSVIRFDLW